MYLFTVRDKNSGKLNLMLAELGDTSLVSSRWLQVSEAGEYSFTRWCGVRGRSAGVTYNGVCEGCTPPRKTSPRHSNPSSSFASPPDALLTLARTKCGTAPRPTLKASAMLMR